jgi:hypothetical protein
MPHVIVILILMSAGAITTAAPPQVRAIHIPGGGIQPQAAVDSTGDAHLIYFKGEPAHGDLFYVRSTDGGRSFSPALRVNSIDGSAIAIGTIRGAHLSIGKANRVHIAWNGSSLALPKAPGDSTPMLYTRMNDARDAFEPQRNVITEYPGLDGGGSIAADGDGNVYIAWHAPTQKGKGEGDRRVWVARSSNDGKTFAPETQAFTDPTGACGCCGMRLFADSHGVLFALYRSATEAIHRDIYLLRSDDHAKTFQGAKISPMNASVCVMSSAVMASSPLGTVAAWETQSQIYWARLAKDGAAISDPIPAPRDTRSRKHPALAVDKAGNLLLVWTEGTGWNKGGSIAWQIYDPTGKPLEGASGRAPGLAVWSLPTTFVNRDGEFTIIY